MKVLINIADNARIVESRWCIAPFFDIVCALQRRNRLGIWVTKSWNYTKFMRGYDTDFLIEYLLEEEKRKKSWFSKN